MGPYRVTVLHPLREAEMPSSVHRTLDGALRAVERLLRCAERAGEQVSPVIRDGRGDRVYHEH